jgi:hypothetical protein
MDYANEKTSSIDKIVYGFSGDSMLLSDKFRIASFLETKKRIFNSTNKPNKNN